MQFKIDTTTKEITVFGPTNLGEFIVKMRGLLGDEFDDYKLIPDVVNVPQHIPTPFPMQPTYPWQPYDVWYDNKIICAPPSSTPIQPMYHYSTTVGDVYYGGK